jgi:hypothetical protein
MLCSVLLFSCSKEKESTVPNVPVNLRLDLDDPANFQLNSVGGSMTIIGGNRGIIVYRRGLNEYSAI